MDFSGDCYTYNSFDQGFDLTINAVIDVDGESGYVIMMFSVDENSPEAAGTGLYKRMCNVLAVFKRIY